MGDVMGDRKSWMRVVAFCLECWQWFCHSAHRHHSHPSHNLELPSNLDIFRWFELCFFKSSHLMNLNTKGEDNKLNPIIWVLLYHGARICCLWWYFKIRLPMFYRLFFITLTDIITSKYLKIHLFPQHISLVHLK